MAAELPPQIQNQIQQFQQLQQQAQVVIQQRQQLEAQVRELDRTVQALEKAETDATIYRSYGSVLIKAKDRDTVKTELTDQKETMEVRLQSTKKQEQTLRDRIQNLQNELQAALGNR